MKKDMKKGIKIVLGLGVVVVGYFLYKKNKGTESTTGGVFESTESTESTESNGSIKGYNEKLDKNVISGISTDGTARFYGSNDQVINDTKVDFKKLGIKVGDKIYATKKGNVGMKITSIYNKHTLSFSNASTYPLFKEPTEYTIRKQQ